MAGQNEGKLNRLNRILPEGFLVDAAWLNAQGYSTSLRSQYLAAGWLEQPTRQVYQRSRTALNWQQVVISLQTLLECDLAVGGQTALELKGYGHYLTCHQTEVHLYGPKRPPTWLNNLPVSAKFVYHNSQRLWAYSVNLGTIATESDSTPDVAEAHLWGQTGQPLFLSSPERAVLEVLDELPDHESFHQVDQLFEGLSNLSPRRLEELLLDCHSVKVKRLFFFFADRHRHGWLSRINKAAIDLGKGKRQLVRGGMLSKPYQITVPRDLDGLQ